MADSHVLRDSLVLLAIIALGAYALALGFGLATGRVEPGRTVGVLLLDGGLGLVVVGLGFLLRRMVNLEQTP